MDLKENKNALSLKVLNAFYDQHVGSVSTDVFLSSFKSLSYEVFGALRWESS